MYRPCRGKSSWRVGGAARQISFQIFSSGAQREVSFETVGSVLWFPFLRRALNNPVSFPHLAPSTHFSRPGLWSVARHDVLCKGPYS